MSQRRHVLAPLAVLAVLGGLTAVPAPSQADTPTCHGLPATIVGTSGGAVSGTSGPDVIVTDGAVRVEAGAGDDTICLTGTPPAGTNTVLVDGNTGSDYIDASLEVTPSTVTLGDDPDTFIGGPFADHVGAVGGGLDTISTGAGDDTVATGIGTDADNQDSIDLGADNDSLTVRGGAPTTTFDGGDGRDQLVISAGNGSTIWTVDNTLGTVNRAHADVLKWTGFERFDLSRIQARRLLFLGSDADEDVVVGGRYDVPEGTQILTNDGDDDIEVAGDDPGTYDGGLGTDHLVFDNTADQASLRVDLANHYFLYATERAGAKYTVERIQDVAAHGFPTTRLLGDSARNTLTITGASTLSRLVGRDGDDRLSTDFSRDSRENGGPGDDTMVGSTSYTHGDLLIGGPGTDRALARNGRDTCKQVEKRVSCELS